MWSKSKVWDSIKRWLFSSVLICCLLGMSHNRLLASNEPKFTVEFTKTSFLDILKYIKKHTMYDFLCNNDEIKEIPLITKSFKDASIEDMIIYCLSGTNFKFRIAHNVIVISRKKVTDELEKEVVIKGKVMDLEGNPLPGATITVKGTTWGMATDVDGRFVLTLPFADSVTLLVQFLGMKSQELFVSDFAKELIVRLEEDQKVVDEVVVTGYGNIRKSSFTGNSINVTREELQKVSKTNVIQALQVFDPSFRIKDNNDWGSDPNSLPEVYMRGMSGIGVTDMDRLSDPLSKSSLKGNPNLPLFILDGFEVSVEKIYDLDPNRIETVTLLKDGAATALYGSRAANGVVIITRVAPKEGQVRVSYNFEGNVTMPDLRDYNLMNAKEKLEAEVSADLFEPKTSWKDPWEEKRELDAEYNAKLLNVERGVDTYWLSKPLQTVLNHKHSVFLEGGSESLRFGIDFMYNNQDGVMKESFRDRMSVGFTLDYRWKNVQIRNSISYGIMNSKESPYGSFGDYTKKLPYDEYKDENGKMLKELYQWNVYVDRQNPLYEATIGNYTKEKYNELIDNLSLNWYITKTMQFKGDFSISKKDREYRNFIHPDSRKNISTEAVKGALTINTETLVDWSSNFLFSYSEKIQKHSLYFVAGMNIVSSGNESLSMRYKGFGNGNLDSPNYAKEIATKPINGDSKKRLFGALASLNYSYNDIYLLDASFRLDGSSDFGSEKRFAPFWALGVGVNLHNYEWLKNKSVFDILKVRGAYGCTGKSNYPAYSAKSTHSLYIDDWYATGMGTSLMWQRGNKNLKWEITHKLDVGGEIGILNNMIYLKASYYSEKTKDLITDVTLPYSTGYTSYKDNLGEVVNKGFEIDLRTVILNKSNCFLSVYANLAHNENRIGKISEAMRAYNEQVDAYYQNGQNDLSKVITKYEEGRSLTAKYGMKSLGIDPATGQELFLNRDGKVSYKWKATEMVDIGDEMAWGQGAFGFNMRYKNWTLYTAFMYEFGGDRYNSTLVNNVENANIWGANVDRRVLKDRWKKHGDKATMKNIADREFTTQPTSRFIQKYNVLKLSSLVLGYEVSDKLLKYVGLKRAILEVGANDIWNISSVEAERGLNYPYAQTVNFSLKINF